SRMSEDEKQMSFCKHSTVFPYVLFCAYLGLRSYRPGAWTGAACPKDPQNATLAGSPLICKKALPIHFWKRGSATCITYISLGKGFITAGGASSPVQPPRTSGRDRVPQRRCARSAV